MAWIVLISLILIGIGLIMAEVIFIPGTTLVGVFGFAAVVAGIYAAYDQFGHRVGNMVMLSSGVFLVATIIIALKSKTWQKIGLANTMESKVNEDRVIGVYEGCVAMAVSDLRPVGTIEFENDQYEAETNGEFINTRTPVKVVSVVNQHIIVEKLKN